MVWHKIVEIALALTVMINCLLVAIFLFTSKFENRNTNSFLGIFLLALCVKLSVALLINFRHEWGIVSYFIFNSSCAAYLAFGPLLFLYIRAILKILTAKIFTNVIFVPMLLPFLLHLFGNEIPLWFMQAFLFLFIILITIDWYKHVYKLKKLQYTAQYNWVKVILISIMAVWLVVNLLFVHRKFYVVELLFIFACVFYFDVFFAMRFYWIKQGDRKDEHKYKNSPLAPGEEIEIIKKLEELMLLEKLYIDPELSLPKLATIIKVKPYKLSQVINQKLDMTFNEYVNSYRVEAIKNALLMPENKDLKIASIAFDYGFNSISVFNTAFKKVAKYTPSQYKSEFVMNN